MQKFRNEDGLSLAELLAVFVIGSIVMIFVSSLLIFVQKQYTSQSETAKKLTDATIAVKSITKDVRFFDVEKVENNELYFTNGPTYKMENSILYKIEASNETAFIHEVEDFNVSLVTNEETNQKTLKIFIKSNNGKKLETEITLR